MKSTVCVFVCLQLMSTANAQKQAPTQPVARGGAVSGGQVDNSTTDIVAGQRLRRNGSGFRMKGPIKVSQIEIFAAKKFTSLEELNQLEGSKRVAITLLTDAPSNFMGKGLTRGIEDNTPKSEMAAMIPMLIRLGETFNQHKTLSAGSKVLIDWIPGQGMLLTINGVVQGEPFRDAALFRALMGIWLGAAPVDPALKTELLGLGGLPARKN